MIEEFAGVTAKEARVRAGRAGSCAAASRDAQTHVNHDQERHSPTDVDLQL